MTKNSTSVAITVGMLTLAAALTTGCGSSVGVDSSWSSGACGHGTAAYLLRSGSVNEAGNTYTASNNDESAICLLGGTAALADPTISTTGATSSTDNSSFYGLDAAVLAYDGGTLTISGGSITTTGQGGNGAFAYGSGVVDISNTTMKMSGGNAHALYAAGGGTMTVDSVTATTSNAAGSVVATDRGGGTITVNGGSYSAGGQRSAGIYSTGTVTARDATFSATNAEAVVIEGSNVVELTDVTLNAVSGTTEHRGVFLYQSMSGDATNNSCGSAGACFTMTGGTFNYTDTYDSGSTDTDNCSAFTVANQTALFQLTDVTVNNSCPVLLLSAENSNWPYGGGTTTFKAYGTSLTGNVIVDNVSTAAITLNEDSTGAGAELTGAINSSDTGKTVSLTLDAASKWVVTGTSYLTTLTDADATYSNIACATSGCVVHYGSSTLYPNAS